MARARLFDHPPARMAQALLVRHCESAGQAPDAPLTARGDDQARALADFLAAHPIDRIVSSPYLRARNTIRPFALRAGMAIEVHEGLAERRLSPEPVENWREVVQRSFTEPAFRVPGGESGAETLERGWGAIAPVLAAGHRLPVIVSHGQLLALVLHAIDRRFGFAGWESLSNPDVYRIDGSAAGGLRFERIWIAVDGERNGA